MPDGEGRLLWGPLNMNEKLKRGGEEDGHLGMELASNLNKVDGNLDLPWARHLTY